MITLKLSKILVSTDSASCSNSVDERVPILDLEKTLEKANVEVLGPSVIVMYSISLRFLLGHIPTTGGRRSSTSVFFFSFFLHCRSSRCRESRTKYLCNVINSLHITVALHSKDGQFENLHTCSSAFLHTSGASPEPALALGLSDDGILPFIRSFSRYNTVASTSLPRSIKSPPCISGRSHPTSTLPRLVDHQPWTRLRFASKTNRASTFVR